MTEINNAVAIGSIQTTDDELEFYTSGGGANTIAKTDLALGTVTQQAAEAGTSEIPASWTPQRVKQAIAGLVTQQLVQGLLDSSFVQGLVGVYVKKHYGKRWTAAYHSARR